jgi:hypothetical protein
MSSVHLGSFRVVCAGLCVLALSQRRVVDTGWLVLLVDFNFLASWLVGCRVGLPRLFADCDFVAKVWFSVQE